MASKTFDASPTCGRFMRSDSFGRLIAGPVGSGKTVACIIELFRRAAEQAPSADGFRYTRFAIVRQTLKQLKETVLKDIMEWLDGAASYKVSESTVYIHVGDIRSEWILVPLDNPEDQRRLLSMQLTGAWMSEAIEMDVGLIAPLSGRCGRYPGASLGGATWFGMIADTNFPSEGSDWHKFMELDTPGSWQIFPQPSGMSPEAENLNWLTQTEHTLTLPIDHPERIAQGRSYYERFVAAYGEDSDWVKRYVYAQYGDDPSGSAVFRESFRHGFHVIDDTDSPLAPVQGHILLIGQDFGRDPCSLICQMDHKGRLLILKEMIAADTGLEMHILRSLRPELLKEPYLGKSIALVGDPAGRSKSTIYEETSFDALKRMGFSAFPAPTNDIDPRLRAVDAWLMRAADGGPAMMISKSGCPTLVRGLSGGYRYAKTKAGQRKPLPDKNEYSHIIDCLQYVCLVAHSGMDQMVGRYIRRPTRTHAPRVTSAAWT